MMISPSDPEVKPFHLLSRSDVLCADRVGSAHETDGTENSPILSVEPNSSVVLSLGQSARCNLSIAGYAQRHYRRAAAA
jgi:hypothetical protein